MKSNIHRRVGRTDGLVKVSFPYEDLGGNVNLIVNGALANASDMTDLHLTTVGGEDIAVQPAVGSGGEVTVSGEITSFALGGQEIYVDHGCGVPIFIFDDGFEGGGTSAWSAVVGD